MLCVCRQAMLTKIERVAPGDRDGEHKRALIWCTCGSQQTTRLHLDR